MIILHRPEFLVEKTVKYNVEHPDRNIIGLTTDSGNHRDVAKKVMTVLLKAKHEAVMTFLESELVKYAKNCFLYTKVLFMNTLYDTVIKIGADYDVVKSELVQDPRICKSNTEPLHDTSRGAGDYCFIKDFEAYKEFYEKTVGNDEG